MSGAIVRSVMLVLVLTGCAVWSRSEEPLPQPESPRERMQLWVSGRAHNVHGVRIANDSISAVPMWKPVACDTCRVRFAVAQVDSVRLESVPAETFFFLGVAVVGGAILYIVEGLKSNAN